MEAASALFSDEGGLAQVISLPDVLGIKGNTHLMMQDNNNDEVAKLIIDWLADPQDKPSEGSDDARPGGRRTGGGKGGFRRGGRGGMANEEGGRFRGPRSRQ